MTGANEAVTDTYRHDAWGVLLERTGSTLNPHTYVGRERYYRMPEAEMYHLGFRDYAQGIGRFMTVDPDIEREGNHRGYYYSDARPVILLDPSGLQACCKDIPLRITRERELIGLQNTGTRCRPYPGAPNAGTFYRIRLREGVTVVYMRICYDAAGNEKSRERRIRRRTRERLTESRYCLNYSCMAAALSVKDQPKFTLFCQDCCEWLYTGKAKWVLDTCYNKCDEQKLPIALPGLGDIILG